MGIRGNSMLMHERKREELRTEKGKQIWEFMKNFRQEDYLRS